MTKEERKEYHKRWYQAHKEERKEYQKRWCQEHKEEHKEYCKEYRNSDLNVNGQTKNAIRQASNRFLNKHGTKIPHYQIHHCCSYTEPYKFIYVHKDLHNAIHNYLREHKVDADSDHYKFIEHLLDDSVVKYGIE